MLLPVSGTDPAPSSDPTPQAADFVSMDIEDMEGLAEKLSSMAQDNNFILADLNKALQGEEQRKILGRLLGDLICHRKMINTIISEERCQLFGTDIPMYGLTAPAALNRQHSGIRSQNRLSLIGRLNGTVRYSTGMSTRIKFQISRNMELYVHISPESPLYYLTRHKRPGAVFVHLQNVVRCGQEKLDVLFDESCSFVVIPKDRGCSLQRILDFVLGLDMHYLSKASDSRTEYDWAFWNTTLPDIEGTSIKKNALAKAFWKSW